MLKRAESRRCEVNTLGILACNSSTFFNVPVRNLFLEHRLQVSPMNFFLEHRLQNLNGLTDFSQENFQK